MSGQKPIPRFSKAEMEAAKERLKQRQNRGSDEAYWAHTLETFKELAPLRERAQHGDMVVREMMGACPKKQK